MNNEDTYVLEGEEIPFLLRQIPQPPKKLFIQGNLPNEDTKFLCIVGSRRNSRYGEEVVKSLVSGLQGYNICIVSGLAIGIDALAHRAAIDAKLKTIAFPGSGLNKNILYPAYNRKLADEILYSGGALVSEFELNEKGAPWTFPQRNRLMAGISHATLVIEAKPLSGSLITAHLSLEFDRELGVVPGDINSELSNGPNSFLRKGAIPITCSEDILEMLGYERPDGKTIQPELLLNLSEIERKIIEYIQIEPHTTDMLLIRTQLTIMNLQEILSNLELQGLIKEINGKFRIS